MRIESNEFCALGALAESVDAALFDLRATVGPKRGAVLVMRRNGENGMMIEAGLKSFKQRRATVVVMSSSKHGI